jgi:hypothetical protein
MTGPLPHPVPRPRAATTTPNFAPAPVAPRRRLSLRPLASVEKISLFEREVRERLSRAALELIFAGAGIMSEGQRAGRKGADAREVFHGSTMLTIELGSVAPVVRDVCDARAAQRLCALLATDATAAARIKSIAAAEAERLCRTRPRTLGAEIKVRARGTTVYVDVDVEASF